MIALFRIALLLVASAAIAAPAENSPANPLPEVEVLVDVSRSVAATECYVLFLLETSGENMTAARQAFERKWSEFSGAAKREFPGVALKTVNVNIGTRGFSSFRGMEEPFSPALAKVVIAVMPPDEALAVRFLDFGIKAGLTPFCGAMRNQQGYGAVYFGLKEPDAEMEALRAQGVAKMKRQAPQRAAELGVAAGRLSRIMTHTPFDETCEVRFRDIIVELPSRFCSGDPDRLRLSLVLNGFFEALPQPTGRQ